jgi:exodeoxyribonuclease V alpha subunit
MIDTILMYHLLKAIPPTATCILVGDVNQLPSVGAGNVLNDIITSGSVAVIELNEIFSVKPKPAVLLSTRIRSTQGICRLLGNRNASIPIMIFISLSRMIPKRFWALFWNLPAGGFRGVLAFIR